MDGCQEQTAICKLRLRDVSGGRNRMEPTYAPTCRGTTRAAMRSLRTAGPWRPHGTGAPDHPLGASQGREAHLRIRAAPRSTAPMTSSRTVRDPRPCAPAIDSPLRLARQLGSGRHPPGQQLSATVNRRQSGGRALGPGLREVPGSIARQCSCRHPHAFGRTTRSVAAAERSRLTHTRWLPRHDGRLDGYPLTNFRYVTRCG